MEENLATLEYVRRNGVSFDAHLPARTVGRLGQHRLDHEVPGGWSLRPKIGPVMICLADANAFAHTSPLHNRILCEGHRTPAQ